MIDATETLATTTVADTERAPTRRLTLYEATEELRAVERMLDESEGELTPEIEEALTRASGTFHDKAARVGLVIREQLAAEKMAEDVADAMLKAVVEGEVARLRVLAARAAKKAASLTQYLVREMERAGVTEVRHELCPLKFHKVPAKLVGEVDAAGLYDMHDMSPGEERIGIWRHLIRVKPEVYELDRAAALREAKAKRPIPPGLGVVDNAVKLKVG